jgi:radical SAM-linked protein
MTAQRLRIVFSKGEEIKYVSHLDLVRVWERALRRADFKLAYSRGFNPRPRLVFASALPVGFTGRAEMVDIRLERPVNPQGFASRVDPQLPAGLGLVSVRELDIALPALPNQLVAAEYGVSVESQDSLDAVQARLDGLLAAGSIPRRRERPEGDRVYDLRPLVKGLWLAGHQAHMYVIAMQLQAGALGTGRPDEVMAALDMSQTVRGIERVRLLLSTA